MEIQRAYMGTVGVRENYRPHRMGMGWVIGGDRGFLGDLWVFRELIREGIEEIGEM